MSDREAISAFLDGETFAVAGASDDRSKFGNKVYRLYKRLGKAVYPVNPNARTVEGDQAYPDLTSLPEAVHGVSIITPPKITESIVEQAIAAGVQHIWMQPGAERDAAIERAEGAGLNVIAGGACILAEHGFVDDE
jgi:predicted CoA-binding protein